MKKLYSISYIVQIIAAIIIAFGWITNNMNTVIYDCSIIVFVFATVCNILIRIKMK